MTNTEKLKQFILDNGLQFTEGRRNSDSVVISGYALYIGASYSEINDAVKELKSEEKVKPHYDYDDELSRVWDYAKSNNYGKWWYSEDSKKTYKF